MKKKIITATFSLTLLLLLLASIAGASTVQACTSFYNKESLPLQLMSTEIIAAAHWTENTPTAGGWIFAALAREPGYGNDAYLYVSGYHPFGKGTTFSGSDPDVKLTYSGNVLSVTTTINFKEVSTEITYELHDVTIQWTIPQIAKSHFGTFNWNSFCAKDTWSDTTANADINIGGSKPHDAFSTSDWATIGILQPQKEVAIAHWIVDIPKTGGWVFAATGKDDNRAKDTWLYVAGYHPADALREGSPATLFQALSTTGVNLNEAKNKITIPTITMNFNQIRAGSQTTVAHDVSATWTANSQPKTFADWKEANADISINIGQGEHDDVSASSWAIADLPSFNWWR